MVLPLRFIPAGAGNTDIPPDPRPKSAVYPRWRGEHNGTDSTNQNFRGLSPLARGTLILVAHADPVPRFIPAGAGNTIRTLPMILLKAVYPRWRGEHTIVRFNNNDRSGLSPLARGTRCQSLPTPGRRRFIPAGAGNTQKACTTSTVKTVYPRWRGEHKKTSVRLLYPIGLSPLARGTLPGVDHALVQARFIPAGAGNTTVTR